MKKKTTSNGININSPDNILDDIDCFDAGSPAQPSDTNKDSDLKKCWQISSQPDVPTSIQEQITDLTATSRSTKLDIENLKAEVAAINSRIANLQQPTNRKDARANVSIPPLVDFGNTWKKFKIVAILLAAFFLYFLVRSPAHNALQPENSSKISNKKDLNRLSFIGSSVGDKESTLDTSNKRESEDDSSTPLSNEPQSYILNDGSAYQTSYYLMLVTKEHKPLFDNEQKGSIDTIIRYLALKQNWSISSIIVRADQVEVALSAPPSIAPTAIVGIFKKGLNRALVKQYPVLATARQQGSLWDRSFCLAFNQNDFDNLVDKYLAQQNFSN